MQAILVVDDDALIRSLAVKTLQSAGYAVDESADGDDAVSKLRKKKFDLVVTDIVMPGRDGISVTDHIRNSGLPVQVIAMSACTDGGKTASALDFARYFAEDVIQKPFTKQQLIDTVNRVLNEQK